jgi:hypothetical protein
VCARASTINRESNLLFITVILYVEVIVPDFSVRHNFLKIIDALAEYFFLLYHPEIIKIKNICQLPDCPDFPACCL